MPSDTLADHRASFLVGRGTDRAAVAASRSSLATTGRSSDRGSRDQGKGVALEGMAGSGATAHSSRSAPGISKRNASRAPSGKGKGAAGPSRAPGRVPAVSASKDKKIAAAKRRIALADVNVCPCSSGGAETVVAEVRSTLDGSAMGMAIGVQVPWSMDVMNGGRLDINYTLARVEMQNDKHVHLYTLSVTETDERLPMDTSCSSFVSQLPTVALTSMSLDFAAATEELCRRFYADQAADIAAKSTSVDDGAEATVAIGSAPKVSLHQSPPTGHDSLQASADGEPLAGVAVEDATMGVRPSSAVAPVEADIPAGLPLARAPVKNRVKVVDVPHARSPLSVTVILRSPCALSAKYNQPSCVPGRLYIFFPADNGQREYSNRC